MREELKTRLSGAGAALVTSAIIAVVQSDKFGQEKFVLQFAGALIGLSWIPFLVFSQALSNIPKLITAPIIIAWVINCFAPTFYALLINLFTGHRVPGSQWWDALWRIYAIMGLWIGFAVLNERVIRPWWRMNSEKYLGSVRTYSVANQAHQMALDKRAKVLDGIKAKVVIVLKRKKLAERTIEEKEAGIEKAEENIQRATRLLEKAKERAETANTEESADAEENLRAMTDLLENALSHKKSIHAQISRSKLDVDETAATLRTLQAEWTEALHIANHTQFFR